jgi:DNA-directed RNA polymerase subunit RPC12/RpoP
VSAATGWPADYTCARCGHPVWHPVWRQRGTRPYHLSCDPGAGPGGPCRYCGQDMAGQWQHQHRCDEADLAGRYDGEPDR